MLILHLESLATCPPHVQWAYWDGVRQYEAKNRAYLQGQIGNPDGAEKPNKKYYDPRMWTRKGEQVWPSVGSVELLV